MLDTTQLSKEFDIIRQQIIGLFRLNNETIFELVLNVNKDNMTIDTICITDLLGVHTTNGTPIAYGQLALFPDNKNYSQMLENPHQFSKWINEYYK